MRVQVKQVALTAVLFLGLSAIGSTAFAQVKSGEIWLTLKGSDYAKPYVDGQEWEDHNFEKNGFKLVIRVEDVDQSITFEIRPSNGQLGPVTFTTDRSKFKVKRMKRRSGRYIMAMTITFKKPGAKPPKTAPKKAPAKKKRKK